MNKIEKRRVLRFMGDLLASELSPDRGEALRLKLIHMPTDTLAEYGIDPQLAEKILDGDVDAVKTEMATEIEQSGLPGGTEVVKAYTGEGRPVLQLFADLALEEPEDPSLIGLWGPELRAALEANYAGQLAALGLGDTPRTLFAKDDPEAIIDAVADYESLPGAHWSSVIHIMTPWPGVGFLLTRAETRSAASGVHEIDIYGAGFQNDEKRIVVEFKDPKKNSISAEVVRVVTNPDIEQIIRCRVRGLDPSKTYCITGGDRHSREHSSIFFRP